MFHLGMTIPIEVNWLYYTMRIVGMRWIQPYRYCFTIPCGWNGARWQGLASTTWRLRYQSDGRVKVWNTWDKPVLYIHIVTDHIVICAGMYRTILHKKDESVLKSYGLYDLFGTFAKQFVSLARLAICTTWRPGPEPSGLPGLWEPCSCISWWFFARKWLTMFCLSCPCPLQYGTESSTLHIARVCNCIMMYNVKSCCTCYCKSSYTCLYVTLIYIVL